MHEMSKRVYDSDFIAPTIHTVGGGNLEPKVAIKQATKNGFAECEIGGVVDLSFPDSKTRRGRVQNGGKISPTITAETTGLCRVEKSEPIICAQRGRDIENPKIRKHSDNMAQMIEFKPDGTSNTLTTVQKDNLVCEPSYRVRKLTPKECWRLMGFDDADFEKARAALNDKFYNGRDRSGSQLYKQAGNSIVVNVLMAQFKEMM